MTVRSHLFFMTGCLFLLAGSISAQDYNLEEGVWNSYTNADAASGTERDYFYFSTVGSQPIRVEVFSLDSPPYDHDLHALLRRDDWFLTTNVVGGASDLGIMHYAAPYGLNYTVEIYHDRQYNPKTYNLRWGYDDAYMTNNTQAEAVALPRDTWLSSMDGKGKQWGDEYFKVVLDGLGGTLVVDCEFTNADGNIELELYDASGTLKDSSTSGSDNESLSTSLPVGTYYIRVFGDDADGNTGNEYDLRWQRDDWFEENDSLITAHNISSFPWIWLSDQYDIGQQCDSDCYKIEVTSTSARRVIAECEFTHGDGNIDLYLINSSGIVVSTRTSTSDNEWLDYTVSSTGTYYLRVFGDNAGNRYDLRWKTSDQGDDYYEENDTRFTAYNLSDIEGDWFSEHHGAAYKQDADWYKITVPASSRRVWIRLLSEEEDADLDLSLCNSAGTELAYSQFPYEYDFITQVVPSAGTYYIQVTGPDSGAEYDLLWSVHPVNDDVYEDNDTIQDRGANIARGDSLAYSGGLGVQADDDYYRIWVSSGYEQVQVDCSFTHVDGDIAVALYDGTGHAIKFTDSSTDNEQLQAVVQPNARYYIRVAGDHAVNTYNLSWNGSPSVAPSDLTLNGSAVDENQPVGTLIGYLSCTDPDDGDTLTYTLLNNPGSDLFKIVRSRLGQSSLETAASFDYENVPSYTIGIKVTDGSGKWTTQDFTITVNDLLEEPPIFSSSTVTADGMILKWDSTAGFHYQIQSTTNLVDGFSTNGLSILEATPPENSFTGTIDGASSRFWKISTEP